MTRSSSVSRSHRRQRILERRPRAAEPEGQPGHLNHPPFEFGRCRYLTADEAAQYLRCPNVRAFYAWASRHRIPKHHRGRCLLFEREELDAAVHGRDLFVELARRIGA